MNLLPLRCKWLLRAQPGQRIHLRFLDISLRERLVLPSEVFIILSRNLLSPHSLSSTDPECTDSVSVSERGKTLLRMCGESKGDIVLLSDGHTLDVSA